MNDYIQLKINNKSITALKGENVFEIMQKEGLHIPNYCQGRGICGKCRVRLEGMFSPLTAEEMEILPEKEQKSGIRLACQVTAVGNGKIWIENEENPVIVCAGRQPVDMSRFSPPLILRALDNKDNMIGLSLAEKFLKNNEDYDISVSVLKKVSMLKSGLDYVFIIRKNEVIDCVNKDGKNDIYGVAFDIGTTTLVAYLVDMCTGRELHSVAMLNPQRAYGDDVLSRISYCDESEGLKVLNNVVADAMNELIARLCKLCSINEEKIYEITVVGNPTMCQLFLGISPYHIGRAPYSPAFRSSYSISAAECGLHVSSICKVTVLPNISGYVGSDTVAGILASEIYKETKPCALIDIGTNGEIVVTNNGEMVACSAAAGPAFEGGRIHLGMRAVDGAVCAVGEKGLSVIGNGKPKGFCGSGIVDAVAYLLQNGVIDKKGVLHNSENVKMLKSQAAYYFNQSLFVTQNDIREVQLAKSAIYTALELALEKLKLRLKDLDRIYVAGSFGSYLNLQSSIRIGLFPELEKSKFVQIGNSAGSGAKMALIDLKTRTVAEDIRKNTNYLELSVDPLFQRRFIANLVFK